MIKVTLYFGIALGLVMAWLSMVADVGTMAIASVLMVNTCCYGLVELAEQVLDE